MSEQLQVYNPNTGKWYEVGPQKKRQGGETLMNRSGNSINAGCCRDPYYEDYPLTPIDTPIEWTLGKNALASVKPELQPRVTGEFRGASHDWVNDLYVDGEGAFFVDGKSGLNYIILSPPPAPAKTDREALLEIQERLRGIKAVEATREFLDKHLADHTSVSAQS